MALLLTISKDLHRDILKYLHDAYVRETLAFLFELRVIDEEEYDHQFYHRCNSLIGGHLPNELKVGRDWLFFLLLSIMERCYPLVSQESLSVVHSICEELDRKYQVLSLMLPEIPEKCER